MISIQRTSPEVVAERWAEVRRRDRAVREHLGPTPPPLNLDAVVELGESVFFTFRGRAYGVPPLPWAEGAKILRALLRLEAVPDRLAEDDLDGYYAIIRELQGLVWRNVVVTSPIRRTLRRVGLFRNPFKRATEGELRDLALFMSGRRTTSGGVRIVPTPESPRTF